MDTSKLKTYAPKARSDFMVAVSKRLNLFGLYADKKGELTVKEASVQGSVMQIDSNSFDAALAKPRQQLVERASQQGFNQLVEHIAYTWFNRLCAIRFMELHGYLDHGLRVLSHPESANKFEILDHAQDVANELGLNRDHIVKLKLAGNKDEELYRELLLGQCHALHKAMPFLFEALDDETELLLPDNLTRTDSILRGLVNDIPEQDWQEVEIIGWLYQFYISEKKDQVIGKVVASVDIPAATQLFTPNWIVKYMVQNSLGAQWLATYPHSPLKGQMEYYIEPAEQTEEVNAQLKSITPEQLNPEELTLIDPASGSGHILVEAYELFKAIYLERGYRQRDVPQLILGKNLFGLDIDERAAQLTGFALMMKGRADDRRLFERGVKLNVMALVDSEGFDAEAMAPLLRHSREGGNPDYGLKPGDLTELKRLFEHATTFGSLIQVPESLAAKLPALKQLSEATSQDLFVSEALKRFGPLVQQAELLAAQYDAVVANPPYMGSNGMNVIIKKFTKSCFPNSKSDLFACFIERGNLLAKTSGLNAMVTMHGWMFLPTFQKMREFILKEKVIKTMTHIGFNSFPSMNSKIALATAFVIMNFKEQNFVGKYINLNDAPKSADKCKVFLEQDTNEYYKVTGGELAKLPGSRLAYWSSSSLRRSFEVFPPIKSLTKPHTGMRTGDDERFIRQWYEVSLRTISYHDFNKIYKAKTNPKWFPFLKGGDFRKWYGNIGYVVNWEDNGYEIKKATLEKYPQLNWDNLGWKISNEQFYFKPCITWSSISLLETFCTRYCDPGYIISTIGCGIHGTTSSLYLLVGLLNSHPTKSWLRVINPSLQTNPGDIAQIPLKDFTNDESTQISKTSTLCVEIGIRDWNAYERSWDFQSLPILAASTDPTSTLESSYTVWITQNRDTIAEMKRLEEENNRLFIDAYGMADELTPDVPIKQITLTVNPAYRYGVKFTEEEQWTRFRQDTMEELVSYAIGCMMGRYSLDAPGLIYAHSGNEGFDPSRYPTFPADDDGIVPLTDTEWFSDDAANRLIEFMSVAWNRTQLEDNLRFLADNLSPRKNESSRDTIRRYLCDSFFKDHQQTYKKRPIYWLFNSGKQKAFQCLVYLHRYNEGTLARMRTEYVTPLLGKFEAFTERLQKQQDDASSTAEANRFKKELTVLQKKQAELREYDDKLKHYADMQISLDLDDGVKVNYGKFGDLLSDVKAITGQNPEVI